MANKPRLLVISNILPFPLKSGQNLRVYNTLLALKNLFHITYLTIAPDQSRDEWRYNLLKICDDVILLPSIYNRNIFTKILLKIIGLIYILATGLKFSNFLISQIELTPRRVRPILKKSNFDCALFEYWHSYKNIQTFRQNGIPCFLDMHDILWHSYERYLATKKMPLFLKKIALRKYKKAEEKIWNSFNGIIAINEAEKNYVKTKIGSDIKLFYAGMGVDLKFWRYCWSPKKPKRIAYYGSLGNQFNQQDALICYHEIMPAIWKACPKTEFWVVGNNPSADLQASMTDDRVKVTGYVENIQSVLGTMTTVLCPFKGKFGFRSRIIEVMAVGTPVVASSDAVWGNGQISYMKKIF